MNDNKNDIVVTRRNNDKQLKELEEKLDHEKMANVLVRLDFACDMKGESWSVEERTTSTTGLHVQQAHKSDVYRRNELFQS